MNLRYFSKILFLLLALSATLFAVIQLNTGHMNDFWTSLGIGKSSHSLNWCNDRLVALEGSKNDTAWILKEDQRQWVVVKNQTDTKVLNYLDIEKWLAKYCILDIVAAENVDALEMKVTQLAFAKFNDGSTARVFKLGDGPLFQINQVIFASTELEEGLIELNNLLAL